MPANESASSTTMLGWLRQLFKRSPRQHGDETSGATVAVCVLIATLLWFLFALQDTYTTTLELPTRIFNLPEDQALTSRPPERVQAQVQGQGYQLLVLNYKQPAVPINAVAEEVDLEVAAPDLPADVRLVSVSPRRIQLQKEPRLQRRVPIALRADVSLPPTHALLQPPQLQPDSVEVTGAASLVRDLEAWPTQPVEIEDLEDSLSVLVPLSDTLSGLVEPDAEVTRASFTAAEFTEDRRTLNVRVTGAPPGSVSLEPGRVRVRYRVRFEDYEAAREAPDFFATVPFDEIRSDTTGRVRPRLHLPEGVTIRDVEVLPPTLGYYITLPAE